MQSFAVFRRGDFLRVGWRNGVNDIGIHNAPSHKIKLQKPRVIKSWDRFLARIIIHLGYEMMIKHCLKRKIMNGENNGHRRKFRIAFVDSMEIIRDKTALPISSNNHIRPPRRYS